MPLVLKLNADAIYSREFAGAKSGYDCLQVDTMLDSVIADYETVANYVVKTDEQIVQLQKANRILSDRVTKLETENAVLANKLADYTGPLSATGENDNLDLLKRIAKLEEMVHNLGGDPTKSK